MYQNLVLVIREIHRLVCNLKELMERSHVLNMLAIKVVAKVLPNVNKLINFS